MSLPFFLAFRLYRGTSGSHRASRPAVLIAKTGIAIGLAVMLVAVSVVVGFKGEVREKIVGFGGHVQVTNLQQMQPTEPLPIGVDGALVEELASLPGVEHVQRFSLKPGLVKTADAFQGVVLKGIGQDYDTDFWRRHLVEGEFPAFGDSASSGRVVISQALADRLQLETGDKLDTYYVENEVRVRRLMVAGIYETHFAEYDNLFLFTDLYTVNRLNRYESDQAGGLELAGHSGRGYLGHPGADDGRGGLHHHFGAAHPHYRTHGDDRHVEVAGRGQRDGAPRFPLALCFPHRPGDGVGQCHWLGTLSVATVDGHPCAGRGHILHG